MKFLAIALLLVNFGLLTWQYRENVMTLAAEQRVVEALPADAAPMKLLAELPALPPQRASEAPAAPPISAEVKADVAAADVCVDIGPFGDAASRDRLRDWLRASVAATYARAEVVRKKQFFWVYMEPSADAEHSLAELAQHGVTDTLLIRRGEMKNSISLGFFRSQDSVNRRLAELNEKGYKPVVVPRFETSNVYWLGARLAADAPDPPDIPAAMLGASAKLRTLDCASLPMATATEAASSAPLVEGLTN